MKCYGTSSVLGLLFLTGLVIAADDPTPNQLSAEEKGQGFRLLFDGKSTNGWRGFRQKGFPEGWQVVDGAIARVSNAGDIITEDQFDNFELRLQWKVAPGSNSGIMYFVSEDQDKPYYTGPEYQILDNAKHPDGRKKITSAASVYALYPPSKDVTRPVGEWNDTKIISLNGKVEHWLNGEKVAEYDRNSDEWKAKVKASKFASMPEFGKPLKGHICLQDHGDPVYYRSIRIRELNSK